MAIVKITKDDNITPSTTRKVGRPQPFMSNYNMVFNEDKESQKQLKAFVKGVKSYIRNSLEYKKLMKFLKREGGMDRCGYHYNVTAEEFSIEIHHHPFVAEDIIYTIIYKRANLNEALTYSGVADEFMRLHYLNLIGLYPLCESCHEYKHSDDAKPFIPLSHLRGEPDMFYELYKDHMKAHLKAKFETWMSLNKGYNILEEYIPEDLIRTYCYITNEDGMHFMTADKLKTVLEELQNE